MTLDTRVHDNAFTKTVQGQSVFERILNQALLVDLLKIIDEKAN
jgi:hypothetical protein